MKKEIKKIGKLQLNKQSISKFKMSQVKGGESGIITTVTSCPDPSFDCSRIDRRGKGGR